MAGHFDYVEGSKPIKPVKETGEKKSNPFAKE